ncbi:methionyl-tRNA formyltransferase, partial [Candidatus Woesebacteria bacterium CG06_land_8_20_14_3_00_39_27]
MKIIFFGTPEYVVPILAKLAKRHEIVAVVTQPPKPVGREQFKKYSPVDDWVYKRDIKILRDLDTKQFPDADLGVCAAYGKIIPQKVIGLFKFGILNIHPSLLPKYRGASPISEAIKNGDTESGVTIIKMDEKMDHGPIITFFKEEILPDDTTESLRERLFERSADVLIQLIPAYISGKVKPKEQNHNEATFTKVLTREDG